MQTRTLVILCGLVIVGLTAAPAFSQNFEPNVKESWTTPLEALGINGSVDNLAEPPIWTVRQLSSFDRTGGNADDAFGEQVYDGGVVLADLEGPGMISRIWTQNFDAIIHIYIDDLEKPLLTFSVAQLVRGEFESRSPARSLFSPPFVGEGSGGYYSYVPIPFKERCRVIVTENKEPLSYQVTYLEFPKDTPLESFQLNLERTDTDFFKRWKKTWDHADFRYHNRKTEKINHSSHKYWPKKNQQVYPMYGPGVITELEMIIEGASEDVLNNIWIAIFFDDQVEPGVLAPIGSFFGSAVDEAADADGMILGRRGGRMWNRFPMPFNSHAEIRFLNLSDEIADIEYWITWKEGEIGDQRYFFARYNEDETVAGSPYVVADLNGSGHFVGATVAASGADSLTFLEGDDSYQVDGRSKDDFHGTGTDAYFNAGWYFAGAPSGGIASGGISRHSEAPAGFSGFRTHVTSPVPFEESFVFELEHGGANDAPGVNYSSVAYWYQNSPDLAPWHAPDMVYTDHLERRAD